MEKTKIYSYVVRFDTGFAPNPFFGYCTLACCKPDIRRCACKGDWIIGTGSKKNVGNDKIIYLMRVTETPFSFREYFNDKRFEQKKPNMYTKDKRLTRGDNVYKPLGKKYKQLESRHSNGKYENQDQKKHDLGKNMKNDRVLVSKEFYYFGNKAISVPNKLRFIIKKGQKHKCEFDNKQINQIHIFIDNLKKGYKNGALGHPSEEWYDEDICHKSNSKRNACY